MRNVLESFLILLIVRDCFMMNRTTSQKEALIVMEETEVGDGSMQGRAGFEEDVCTPQSICIPITSCPLLDDLLDKACLASDKLTALTCGWSNGEARVCCPPGGMNPIGPARHPGGVQADEEGAASSPQVVSDTCGRPMVQARSYEGIGSHPWVVRIGFKNQATSATRYPCSGSIISRRVILTAAHCALAKAEGYKLSKFDLSSVAVGEWNTETDPDCGDMFCASPVQNIPISHVIVHPGFDKKIYRHDIALVVLREDIKYTMTSLPICVSGIPAPIPGTRAALSGWGRLAGQSVTKSERQLIYVPLVSSEDCARVYSSAARLSEAQFCAGGEAGHDACAGFGGAPLISFIDGKYTQIGIVSFGSEKCGTQGIPSVYTNVYSYANWIKDNSPPA